MARLVVENLHHLIDEDRAAFARLANSIRRRRGHNQSVCGPQKKLLSHCLRQFNDTNRYSCSQLAASCFLRSRLGSSPTGRATTCGWATSKQCERRTIGQEPQGAAGGLRDATSCGRIRAPTCCGPKVGAQTNKVERPPLESRAEGQFVALSSGARECVA